MMLIDPPSPFAPEADWREFLQQMEALASELSRDAALVRSYVRTAKQQLAIPLDDKRFKCPHCKLFVPADRRYCVHAPIPIR